MKYLNWMSRNALCYEKCPVMGLGAYPFYKAENPNLKLSVSDGVQHKTDFPEFFVYEKKRETWVQTTEGFRALAEWLRERGFAHRAFEIHCEKLEHTKNIVLAFDEQDAMERATERAEARKGKKGLLQWKPKKVVREWNLPIKGGFSALSS